MSRFKCKPYISVIDGELKYGDKLNRRKIHVKYEPEKSRAGLAPEKLIGVTVNGKYSKKNFTKIKMEHKL